MSSLTSWTLLHLVSSTVDPSLFPCFMTSYLLAISFPSILPLAIRQVPGFQQLTPREKEEVMDLVDTLIALRLSFGKDSEKYGYGNREQYFKLEPEIDLLVKYSYEVIGSSFLAVFGFLSDSRL